MRDALSMLDQLIAFCCDKEEMIDENDVNLIFGLASSENILNLIFAMVNNKVEEIINQVNILTSEGKNIDSLYQNLLEYLRQVMIISISKQNAVDILKIDESEAHLISNQIQNISPTIFRTLVDGFIEYENDLRYTLNKRIFFEATLLKITQQAHSVTIDSLIEQLNQLRRAEPKSIINTPIENSSKKKNDKIIDENNIKETENKLTNISSSLPPKNDTKKIEEDKETEVIPQLNSHEKKN